MNSINSNPNKKVRKFAKDLQSALFVENSAAQYANNGDLEELQHGLEKIHQEPIAHNDQKSRGGNKPARTSNDRDQEANYTATSKGQTHNANMAHMYQGCRVCGQNVVYLDGKCNAVIPSGIRDSSHSPQANVAHGIKANHNVLFEDNDWRGEAFHLPISIDASIFDGLDDTTSPIIPTATILGILR
jgi:hypothetical protein